MKNYMITLFINLLFHFKWSIPAWILLILHLVYDWSIYWFLLAFSLWILNSMFWMAFIGWANKCSSIKDERVNKNPYSKKTR